jgi:beta-N-acetylhexosaminidase
MNTPEPFSQGWERQQQSGQPWGERMTPYPSNAKLPPQMAQGQPPYQMPGMNGAPQPLPPPWNMDSPPTSPFPPPSTPFPAPTSQPTSWQGSGMPNATGNLGMPATGNLGRPQTGRLNSDHLSPPDSLPPLPPLPPTMTNSWGNGANTTTGRLNGPNGFSPPHTPMPPNNTALPQAKLPRRNASRAGKILLFLGLALLVVTLGTAGAYMFSGSIPIPVNTTQVKPTIQPTPTPTVHMQHQALAQQYVAQMNLNDEIAQLLMVEQYSADYTDLATLIKQQHIGSVILYASAIVSQSQVQRNISNMQQHATLPVFISIDEEGWNVGRLRALYPDYPTRRMDARAIGLTGDPNVATQQGDQTAKDMLSLGINMNLAPDVDVSTDDGYIGYDRRSFGSTPDAVIKYAGAYLKALQTAGVVGTLKHFPGLGSIPKGFDPHALLPEYTGTKDQLYQTDLVPFQHFIQDKDPYEQASVIMSTDMLVKAIDPTYPAELSHIFITDILRNQLGFQGVILSDSLHMGGVLVNGAPLSLADASVLALEAGNDILEGASTPAETQAIIDAINAAVQSGKVTKAQIDASVTRVLTLQMDFNVMPAVPPGSATPTVTP